MSTDRMSMLDLRAFAIQTARETFRPPGRPCEQCDRTAWYVTTDQDGCRSYQCSVGHLLIVTPEKTETACP